MSKQRGRRSFLNQFPSSISLEDIHSLDKNVFSDLRSTIETTVTAIGNNMN